MKPNLDTPVQLKNHPLKKTTSPIKHVYVQSYIWHSTIIQWRFSALLRYCEQFFLTCNHIFDIRIIIIKSATVMTPTRMPYLVATSRLKEACDKQHVSHGALHGLIIESSFAARAWISESEMLLSSATYVHCTCTYINPKKNPISDFLRDSKAILRANLP